MYFLDDQMCKNRTGWNPEFICEGDKDVSSS